MGMLLFDLSSPAPIAEQTGACALGFITRQAH